MPKKLSLDKNLKFEEDGSIRYMGDKDLHILIPKIYEKYQMIKVDSNVTTLGIFDFWYEEDQKNELFIPAMLTMQPSTVVFKVMEGKEYVYCVFHKGDIFIKSRYLVKSSFIAFAIFDSYLAGNHLPDTIPYNEYAFLFNKVAAITGSDVGKFNNVAFEILFAHTSRDVNNTQIPYRLTDMKNPPKHITLGDVPHITNSLTAKLISGYLKSSIINAINNDIENESTLEEILRQ